jgi:hypothetical protein
MPKTFKELAQVDEACWIGYRQDGNTRTFIPH